MNPQWVEGSAFETNAPMMPIVLVLVKHCSCKVLKRIKGKGLPLAKEPESPQRIWLNIKNMVKYVLHIRT